MKKLFLTFVLVGFMTVPSSLEAQTPWPNDIVHLGPEVPPSNGTLGLWHATIIPRLIWDGIVAIFGDE